MNVAVLAPLSIAKYVETVAREEINNINITSLIYQDFKEVVVLISKNQSKYDGFLFGGIVPYEYAKNKLKEENIWEYIPVHESSLTNSLFQALYCGYNIENISFDTYTKENLEEIYRIIGIDIYNGNQTLILENDDKDFEKYNERAI